MDGVSSATAVLQLIQTTAQVTSLLTQYAISVKKAESSCRKLSEDLKLLSRAAEVVQAVLKKSSVQNTPHDLIEDCFRNDGVFLQSKKALDDLSHSLGTVKTKMKWTERVKWPLKEKDINAAIQVFERYRPHLQMILEIKIASDVEAVGRAVQEVGRDVEGVGTNLQAACRNVQVVRDDVKEIGQDIKDINQAIGSVDEALNGLAAEQERTKMEHINDAERALMKSILDWFKAVDCTVEHESTRNLRQSETCKWLFEVGSFVEWKEYKTSFLWLNGIAGSGKSVLASAVIDNIKGGLSKGGKLVYFYIEFRTPETLSSVEVLRSLLVQLLRNTSINWLPLFDDLIRRKNSGAAPPEDYDSLVRLLKQATALHKRSIAVIDGLDECKDLPQLLATLTRLNDGHLQLLCVSRPEVIIKEEFSSLPSISLSDMTGPLLRDMHQHIIAELGRRRNLKRLDADQKEQICLLLLAKAQGMFKWVECQLDRLERCRSPADIEHTLHSLPTGLFETYDRMLDDIQEREFDRVIVRRLIPWLMVAREGLSLHGLSKVLKVDPTRPVFNASIALLHEEDIFDIFGCLVTSNKWGTVTLSHYTVYEYLTDPSALQRASNSPRAEYFTSVPAAHLHVGKLCMHHIIAYINKLDFVRVQHDECSLLKYALEHGPRHIADIPEDDDSISLLETLQEHLAANPKLPAIYYMHNPFFQDFACPHPVVKMIIEYGPPWLLCRYLDRYPTGPVNSDNPLVYAVKFGKVPQAQLLLDHGVDVNAEGQYFLWKLSPLEVALWEGNEELIKMFLARGSRLPEDILVSNPIRTPAVVRMLMHHGVDMKPKEGKTILHNLSRFGHWEAMRVVVEAGCVPELLPCKGGTLLVLAAANSHFSIAEWLLDRGCQLPVDFLPRAIQESLPYGTRWVVEWSLRHRIAVNSQTSGVGDNALHALMCKCFTRHEDINEVAGALIGAGCDINSQNTSRKTPLHIAVERQPTPTVEYLIDRGARVHANMIHSLLNASTDDLSHVESKLRVLMRSGLDVNEALVSLSSVGDTILHELCWVRARNITASESWRCGLYWPDRDDRPRPRVDQRLAEDTTLTRARLLQELGFDLTSLANIDNDGFTALRIALDFEVPSPQIISYLIDLGETFSNVNYLPLENLSWAVDMPWYPDAVAACRKATVSRSMTPHDIQDIRHALTHRLNSPRHQSRHIVDFIMETAELWACASITHRDIRFGRHTTQVLSVPEFPPDAQNSVVQRIVFSYAGKYRDGKPVERRTGISRSLVRSNDIVHETSDELEFKGFSSDGGFYWVYHTTTEVFWDRRHPSGKGQAVFEPAPGDALVLKRNAPEGMRPSLQEGGLAKMLLLEAELGLEFYQIDMYYSVS